MKNWQNSLTQIEALEDIDLDQGVLDLIGSQITKKAVWQNPLTFYIPGFKRFDSSELEACQSARWPAVSITGAHCKLQCDHCKAEILRPMFAVETPQALWEFVEQLVEEGGKGLLLTGGSNHRNEIEYDPYFSTIRRIKDTYPFFQFAVHTALVNQDVAYCMEQAGIDIAMMDVIGSQETITQVYHLKRSVDDFEYSLSCLTKTNMRVVPHIVVGLHYGRLLGEWQALDMVRRHKPEALVLVVVMPHYASSKRPFVTPDPHAVGRFFIEARNRLDAIPLQLGCARPAGRSKLAIDTYAVLSGFDGIAYPSEGVVELANRIGREVNVASSCCSVMYQDSLSQGLTRLDLDTITTNKFTHSQFKNIEIVTSQ